MLIFKKKNSLKLTRMVSFLLKEQNTNVLLQDHVQRSLNKKKNKNKEQQQELERYKESLNQPAKKIGAKNSAIISTATKRKAV